MAHPRSRFPLRTHPQRWLRMSNDKSDKGNGRFKNPTLLKLALEILKIILAIILVVLTIITRVPGTV